MKLPKLEQVPGYNKPKEENKAKQQFKPGGSTHSTIKGKLHGIMPQTIAVQESGASAQGKPKKRAKPGYRQCKLIEDVERAVASLGPVKKQKQTTLGLTGLKKEL